MNFKNHTYMDKALSKAYIKLSWSKKKVDKGNTALVEENNLFYIITYIL